MENMYLFESWVFTNYVAQYSDFQENFSANYGIIKSEVSVQVAATSFPMTAQHRRNKG